MWFIESEGFRIGPDWYTEAGPFRTEREAEAYLTDHHRELNPQGRKIRIRFDDEQG